MPEIDENGSPVNTSRLPTKPPPPLNLNELRDINAAQEVTANGDWAADGDVKPNTEKLPAGTNPISNEARKRPLAALTLGEPEQQLAKQRRSLKSDFESERDEEDKEFA
jgi:hypothetical protein